MERFEAHELLCPHVLARDGDSGLKYIDPRLKEWLEWFSRAIGKPVYVNNYKWGGDKSQRGLRCNLCDLVVEKTKKKILYATAHIRFQAVDFNVKGMNPDQVREWIEDHQEEMPHPIRIEKDTKGWTHVDVVNTSFKMIIYFSAE